MPTSDRTPPSSDLARSPSRTASPPPPRRIARANGHANGNGNQSSSHGFDPADREKDLAEQLRRRAMASREPQRSSSRSRSRTPPSQSSRSPSPRPTSSRQPSRRPIDVRSRSRSRSPERRRVSGNSVSSSKRRRDDDRDREYERRKRRSGRDSYDEDNEDGRSGYSRRRSGQRYESEDQDDARSQRSGYSHHRDRAVSRDHEAQLARSRYRDDDRTPRSSRSRVPSDYDPYYGRPAYDPRYYYDQYSEAPIYDRRRRRSPSPVRRSPSPDPEDYELRSIFCSQLAAKLTRRDLGEFFEEKLGDGAVKDVRIVTDRITGRSKGIGYVELSSEALVQKAIACSGTTLYGIPILVQQTEAARNRGEGASTAQTPIRPNMPDNGNPVPPIDPSTLANLPLPPHLAATAAARLNGQASSVPAATNRNSNAAARLYVGNLNFNLADTDVRAVFEPFGEIEDVDLHREPTGKSKGFAFVQFKLVESAESAIEQMNGFELYDRKIRVGHVNARGQEGRTGTQMHNGASSGSLPTLTSSFDEGGGGGLTAQSRANLMQMLARSDPSATPSVSSQDQKAAEQIRPASIPQATSKAVLLKNMFNAAEESEPDWDTDLAEDVKQECESKYGKVEKCHVDRDSSGEIWLRFADVSGAAKAIAGLNGRYFGGRPVSAEYISESFLTARLG